MEDFVYQVGGQIKPCNWHVTERLKKALKIAQTSVIMGHKAYNYHVTGM